jgi:predicted DNA-binding transcriptional regulator AlpA
MPFDKDFSEWAVRESNPRPLARHATRHRQFHASDKGKRGKSLPQTPPLPQTSAENCQFLIAPKSSRRRCPGMRIPPNPDPGRDPGHDPHDPHGDPSTTAPEPPVPELAAAARWWTIKDVATHLSVSECTARRLAQRRDFPPVAHFGRLRRWRSDQVAEWADRQTVINLYRAGGALGAGRPRGPRGGHRG